MSWRSQRRRAAGFVHQSVITNNQDFIEAVTASWEEPHLDQTARSDGSSRCDWAKRRSRVTLMEPLLIKTEEKERKKTPCWHLQSHSPLHLTPPSHTYQSFPLCLFFLHPPPASFHSITDLLLHLLVSSSVVFSLQPFHSFVLEQQLQPLYSVYMTPFYLDDDWRSVYTTSKYHNKKIGMKNGRMSQSHNMTKTHFDLKVYHKSLIKNPF